jgi:hypothetical protein
MNKIGALCLAVIFLGTQAVQPQEQEAMVDKAIKAMGGADKLAKFKTFASKSKGNMYVPGPIGFTEEGSTHFPDKFRHDFELDINGVKIKQWLVINGSKGWLKTGDSTVPLTKAQRSGFRAYFYALRLSMLPMELKSKQHKLAPLGEIKIGDRPAVGIQVGQKDFPDVNIFLDRENNLPLKTEFVAVDYLTGREVTHEFLYKDYKEVEGAKLPFRMIWNKDGKKFAEREVGEIKGAERFDDSVFAEP